MNGTTDRTNGTTLLAVSIALALLALAPSALAQGTAPNQDASVSGAPTPTPETPSAAPACSDGYGRDRASELSCSAIPELLPGYGFSAEGRLEIGLSVAYWAADALLTLVEEDDDKPLGTVELGDIVLAATASTINREGRVNGAAVGLVGRF